jgi:hypothetical protein
MASDRPVHYDAKPYENPNVVEPCDQDSGRWRGLAIRYDCVIFHRALLRSTVLRLRNGLVNAA